MIESCNGLEVRHRHRAERTWARCRARAPKRDTPILPRGDDPSRRLRGLNCYDRRIAADIADCAGIPIGASRVLLAHSRTTREALQPRPRGVCDHNKATAWHKPKEMNALRGGLPRHLTAGKAEHGIAFLRRLPDRQQTVAAIDVE
jgi:hypothetical protein